MAEVKLVAVDMDGTFLDDGKNYNRARFQRQYAQLKARGIRFVVASGNQYYQLRSFFPASPMRSRLWRRMALMSSKRAKIALLANLPAMT